MSDAIEATRRGELYPLLSLCTKEDLDPLVGVILSRLSNLLDGDDDYKKYKPDHTKYYKRIGNEIRLFGGNSFRNIFRGGEGPSYAEIVFDVCKKLDVPCVEGDTIGNEANLLDIFVPQRWQSLDPAERQRLAEDARKAASGELSSVATLGKAAAEFVIARLAFGPAGWAALGISLFDANFKVTVPCVLHIAYLRRRILEDWAEDGAKRQAGPDASTEPDPGDALVISGEDGEQVLSLTRMRTPVAEGAWRKVDPSDDGISRLNPLLAAVPQLAVAAEVGNTHYMKAVCNGPLTAFKKEAGAFMGGVKGPDGKFVEQARLFEADRLSAVVNVSALMNVASIALAQKHLADISKKLGDIKNGIDGIEKFQHDERHAKLTGSIHYFEENAPAIIDGERPSRILDQIERHESDLLQVQDHVREDIRAELEALRNLKDEEWFGSAEAKSAIEGHQQRIVGFCRELILCLRARACGWQLLCLFPGEEGGKAVRRRDIQESLDALKTDGKLMTETDSLLRKRIHELASFWNKGITVNDRKLQLLKKTERLLASVAAERGNVMKDLHAADEMLAALRTRVEMVARIENGRITGIKAL